MEFTNIKIENGYTPSDIMYYLNSKYHVETLRNTKRKSVYVSRKNSAKADVIVKKWREVGYLRDLKNSIRGGSRAIREAQNLILLEKNDIGVPRLVSYGHYKEVNSKWYVSFMITEKLISARTYYEISEEYHTQKLPRARFYAVTDKVAETIAKIHSSGITHSDLNIENILVVENKPECICIYLLDTLAVKKRKNKCLYCLIDIAKFYFLALNDPSGMTIQHNEAEYILKKYYKKTKPLYPYSYSIFRFLVRTISGFISSTYSLNKLIRNIQ